MRVKDTCPSCGSPVAPDDLLCANCELILDAARIPNQPSPSELSVVRRMLERPQTGVPTGRPAMSGPKKYEPPTRVLPQRSNRVPLVVASLTKKMASLSELEAFVVSFIDGENDVAELARKTGLALLEVSGVLQSLNDKMVIDFADDEPVEARPKPVVTGSSPTIKFDPDAFQVPESKPKLEPLSFLPTPVTESRLAAREVDEARAALVEPATLDQPVQAAEADRTVTPAPDELHEPSLLAQTQPLEPVSPRPTSTAETQLLEPVTTLDDDPHEQLTGSLLPPPSPPQRQRPSEAPPPHAQLPPEQMVERPGPPVPTPPAAPSAPGRSAAELAPAPEVVLPPPSERRPRRVLKSSSVKPAELERLPSTHSTALTPAEGTLQPVLDAPAEPSLRPTVQLPAHRATEDPASTRPTIEVPALEEASSTRPPPTVIDPELQKMLHTFRAVPVPAGVVPAAPVEPQPVAPVSSAANVTTDPAGSPVAVEALPSIIVSPIATPPEPLEPVQASGPSPSRPRRTLPSTARSSVARTSAPLKLDEGRPASSPLPRHTVPLAELPPGNTDPRILHRGQGNRRILDALKQVKRRETGPDVSLQDPSDHGTTADRLAAGTLQVAIRMEQGGRLDEAIRYLENAIGKSPDAPTLYNRLAIIVLRERADLVRAEQLLQKAIELAPGNAVYEKNLQAVLAKRAMKEASRS